MAVDQVFDDPVVTDTQSLNDYFYSIEKLRERVNFSFDGSWTFQVDSRVSI